MSEGSTLSLEKLTKVYLKMTAKRTELKSAFDAEYNLLTQERDKVKQALLNYCKENNVDSLKLQKVCFTVQLSRVIGRVIGNPCTNLYLRTRVPEFFDKRLNQKNVRQYLEENPDKLPKGLNSDSSYTLSVRRPKK